MIHQAELKQPPKNRLGNLKVLLAEDNEVNQLLASSILHYWGLESKSAVTGTEVLELLKNEEFDVILMDIQMPEKSGIEASVEIRNLGDERKRNIPIIALTANALKGEEKKYMAAGMDDYLTKPFKENELYEVITRVFNHKGSFGRPLEQHLQPIKNAEPSEKLYDLKNLYDISRGNNDFVLTLVRIFLDTVPADCRQMAVACSEKKWDQAGKIAHKLKPTIDTMKMESLKEIIRTIELDGRQGVNTASLPALIQKVITVVDRTAASLRAEFQL